MHSEFRSWSSRQVFNAVDALEAAERRVQAGLMTRGDYNDLEMSTGLNRNPLGLLASDALRPFVILAVTPTIPLVGPR